MSETHVVDRIIGSQRFVQMVKEATRIKVCVAQSESEGLYGRRGLHRGPWETGLSSWLQPRC